MAASDRISGLGQGGAKKGTIVVSDGTGWQTLPPGTANQVLAVDASQSLGLKWATGGAGGGLGSVGLTMPAEFSVANSPLTSDGTIAVTRATQTANTVMAGPTSGGAAAPTFRALVAADLPYASLRIDSHYGTITADSDGATITFDLAVSDKHAVTLGGNRTLALSNATTGQAFTVILTQDATGSRTVTWWSGIKWAGGSAPTLTTTATKADVLTFICTGAGAYLGFVAGQNH